MRALGTVPSALPAAIAPQLATVVERPPVSGDWSYEVKLDGYRMLARIDGGATRIYTRNGHDWTRKLSQLATALARLPVTRAWLDGELVALSAEGLPDFNTLQTGLAPRPTSLTYFVFDLLHLHGYDLRPVQLRVRRSLLHMVLEHHTHNLFRYSEAFAEVRKARHSALSRTGAWPVGVPEPNGC
jgi:bifunctional non-homologous end joining protein LigD